MCRLTHILIGPECVSIDSLYKTVRLCTETILPRFKSRRFCGKAHATKGRFCVAIGPNISGPLPGSQDNPLPDAHVPACLLTVSARRVVGNCEKLEPSDEGPKRGGLFGIAVAFQQLPVVGKKIVRGMED